jgi:hypothetical protein
MRKDALEVDSAMHITIIVGQEHEDPRGPHRSITIHVPPVGNLLNPRAVHPADANHLVKDPRSAKNTRMLLGWAVLLLPKIVAGIFHYLANKAR